MAATHPPDPKQLLRAAADAISADYDADVLLINAPIYQPLDLNVMRLSRGRRRKTNLVFMLVTGGGDADVAFRIARCFQEHYERVFCYLTGVCKSAGTLVTLGANEFIVSDTGELGPIDVQMSKPDELVLRQSGLTATAALDSLNHQAFEAFSYFFIEMLNRSNSSISTKTATHIATQMVSGLFAPLYSHVDPMHVGEAGRALQVAQKYGELLQAKSGNFSSATLVELTASFPSHSFVIDRAEIVRLFKVVRPPSENELQLAELLGDAGLKPMAGPKPFTAFLSTQRPAAVAQSVQPPTAAQTGGNNDHASAPAGTADATPGNAGENTGGKPRTSVSDHPPAPEPALAVAGS